MGLPGGKGSLPSISKHYHMLGVRIPLEDRDVLFEIAEFENRSVAGLIRHMIAAKISSYKKRVNK